MQPFTKQFFLSVLSAAFLFVGPAFAQTETSNAKPDGVVNIAILNLDVIRRQSLVVKGIRSQIEEYRKQFQDDIEKEEKALRDANQELAKKRTILAPEAFAQERRKFEQRVVEVQRLVQQRRQELGKAQSDAMVKVELKLNEIINKMAEDRKIDLVLKRSQTIMVARSLEITKDVLEVLDKTLPKVEVAKPGN